MKNKTALTIILALFVALALGCQFQCGSTPDSNSAATNSVATNTKPTEKATETPKANTASNNAEAPKTETSKSDSADSAKTKTTIVKFEKGKTSAEYENTVGNGETQIYVVNVKEGQYLGAQTYADDDVPFIVRKKGGEELEVPEGSVKWGGDVPESGDYEIVISGIKKSTKYSITISAE